MPKLFQKITFILQNQKLIRVLISYANSGFLYQIGWINSYQQKLPVDKDNAPLPWVTYSFIEFIKNRLDGLNIFEFGSGNSSFFYSKRCSHLTSVEHEKDWYEKLIRNIPGNMTLEFADLEDEDKYSANARNSKKKFQLIIVDGRQRVACMKNSIEALTEDGVLVLDDSERDEYKVGIDFIKNKGFKSIDFWGISPGLFYNKSTSIYYRANNCLGV